MSIVDLLTDLQARDIKIWLEDDKLKYSAPNDGFPAELRAEVSERKAEILRFLQHTGARPGPLKAVEHHKNLPLSFAEERLWFIHQLTPDIPVYNLSQAYRLEGALNQQALEKAIASLVDRHEILRTTFRIEDGRPVRFITDKGAAVLAVQDLQGLSDLRKSQRLEDLLNREANYLFDLATGPLFRVALLRLAAAEYILVITMHHIITDGWSFGVLWRELGALYARYCQGQSANLADLAIQYSDFAHWQRFNQEDQLAQQLGYWQKQLEGIPSMLNLPTDQPRPVQQSYQGSSLSISLSAQLTKALKQLSHTTNSTLFMTLLTAFKILLFRYSQQEDIVVGTPIANRQRPELEGLIGFFVNTLVLRTQVAGSQSFRDALAFVREMTLDAYQHQDLPFERLVEELQPERSLSHHPLFQVMFILQNAHEETLSLSDLHVQKIARDQHYAQFDLILSMTEKQDTLQAHFSYATDLFAKSTIRRMAGHFQMLLEGIIANPGQPIASLPLLTEPERHQLLVAWNDTSMFYPQDLCVHQLFEAQVEKTPDAVAVVFRDEAWTYQELNARANQLAHHLMSLGVKPEVKVGVCIEQSVGMMISVLAILKSGGVYVPLDRSFPDDRLEFVLDDADIEILLTQTSVMMPKSKALRINLSNDTYDTLSIKNPHINQKPNNLIYIMYTSGSTGKPKGVAMCHGSITNLIAWHAQHAKATQSRTLQLAPLSFDVSCQEIFSTWCSGGTLILSGEQARRDPHDLLETLISQGVNRLFVPFVTLEILAEVALDTNRMPNELQDIITAGEQLKINSVLRAFFKRMSKTALHNHYGPTETHLATSYVLTEEAQNWPSLPPIGKPIGNTQLYILDAYLQPVPIGVVGTIYIGGSGVARGYVKRPRLTTTKFIADPFSSRPDARLYRTGDLAKYMGNGNIEFLGRSDHQVKLRGFRIELGEIEAVLGQHPAIKDAVIDIETLQSRKQLIAYFVADSRLGRDEVHHYLAKTLPDYMLPSSYVQIDALPLSANGKVDRKALRSVSAEILQTQTIYEAARDTLERQLVHLWEGALQRKPVGIHDDFFDLGGHSLLAVRLFHEIHKLTDQHLPISTLFQHPTVAGLAEVLREQDWSPAWTSLVSIQARGAKPPLFLVPPAAGTALSFRKLAGFFENDQPIYAFDPVGMDGTAEPHRSVEQMAQYYLKEMRDLQPEGPYIVGGMCFGGFVALEMARQLETIDQIAVLVLLDPGLPFKGPTWSRQPTSLRTPLQAINRTIYHIKSGTLLEVAKARMQVETMRYQRRHSPYGKLWQAHHQAQLAYQAKALSARILLIQNQQYGYRFQEGWSQLCLDQIEHKVIPNSTHRSLLKDNDAHIQQMAEHIQAYLAESVQN